MTRKSDGSHGDLNGFLDAGSHIQGDLHFEDTFRIDGRLTGKVTSKGDLIVGDGGRIEGEIEAGRVYVSGVVKGLIRASRRLEIAQRGKVYADVQTTALIIEEGAFFEGRCAMAREEGSDAASPKLVKPVPLQKG
jgi:cytoskeletal protein CcmA (bactofilin family)